MYMSQVVLLDGGMGQELMHRGAADDSPLWGARVMLDSPDLVRELHVEYIEAGAKVITLNTYSCTPERLLKAGVADQFAMLQSRAFELATDAREKAGVADVKIAACLPPLVGSYMPESTPEYEVALNTYRLIVAEQADKVDLFICETMSCIQEARASGLAASESGKPYWMALSVSDDSSGNLRSNETIELAYEAISASSPQALLLNCSLPEAINAAWPHLHNIPIATGAYANGFTSIADLKLGGSVGVLEARTDLGPEEYARVAMQWVANGASVVGGCCEISPMHIKKLADELRGKGIEIVGTL